MSDTSTPVDGYGVKNMVNMAYTGFELANFQYQRGNMTLLLQNWRKRLFFSFFGKSSNTNTYTFKK
jgi:hypothetical protein